MILKGHFVLLNILYKLWFKVQLQIFQTLGVYGLKWAHAMKIYVYVLNVRHTLDLLIEAFCLLRPFYIKFMWGLLIYWGLFPRNLFLRGLFLRSFFTPRSANHSIEMQNPGRQHMIVFILIWFVLSVLQFSNFSIVFA